MLFKVWKEFELLRVLNPYVSDKAFEIYLGGQKNQKSDFELAN